MNKILNKVNITKNGAFGDTNTLDRQNIGNKKRITSEIDY